MIIVKNTDTSSRPRGRPRAFDREAALGKAAETFWQRGYEGTSIADLTKAMRITPQSLYAAFRSKAELYAEALEWYQAHIGAEATQLLEEKDAVQALSRLLRENARRFTDPARPHGCMISTAVLTCAEENKPVALHTGGMRGEALDLLKARVERGIREGQLRPDTSAGALSRFVGAMVQGMSIQALDGASEADLSALAEVAIAQIERYRA